MQLLAHQDDAAFEQMVLANAPINGLQERDCAQPANCPKGYVHHNIVHNALQQLDLQLRATLLCVLPNSFCACMQWSDTPQTDRSCASINVA